MATFDIGRLLGQLAPDEEQPMHLYFGVLLPLLSRTS